MDTFLFVGSYTRKMDWANGSGQGISVYQFNESNGNPKHIKTFSAENECGPNPSAFYVNDKANCMYICNELDNQSSLTEIHFDAANYGFNAKSVFSQNSFGCDPCFVISDWAQNYLYTAIYGGNEKAAVCVYQIDKLSNSLKPFAMDIITESGSNVIPSRQQKAHMHTVMPSSDPLHFYANDLGRDKLYHYQMNKDNASMQIVSFLEFEGGDGPRHLCFNPMIDGIMYVSLEMGSKIAVIRFDEESKKLIKIIQSVSSLPSHIKNDCGSVYTTSHILCDANGHFLYCLNRGHDSIVRYVINKRTGLLVENSDDFGPKWIECGGKVPRHFGIDPSNKWLVVANQEGAPFDNISVFRINHAKNGILEFVQSIQTGCPSFIQFVQKPKRLCSKL